MRTHNMAFELVVPLLLVNVQQTALDFAARIDADADGGVVLVVDNEHMK